mgnify:CR=1 FL=1
MIEELHLENFQSHKDSRFSFVPGINVITGKSNSGKSSIIRALNWVINNRPSGDAFKTHGEDEVVASIVFQGDHRVKRLKSKTRNEYTGPDGDVYKALRSDVPYEISDVVDITYSNVQQQHDKFFLLQESSGEVAKKLHELCGLGIIDDSFKRLQSKISTTKKELRLLNEQHDSLQEELLKYEALSSMENLLSEAYVLEERKKKVIEKTAVLRNHLFKKKELDGKNKKLVCIAEKESITRRFYELLEENKRIQETILKIQRYRASITASICAKEKVRLVGLLRDELCFVSDIKQDVSLVTSLRKTMEQCYAIKQDVKRLTEDRKAIISKMQYCPLCTQQMRV